MYFPQYHIHLQIKNVDEMFTWNMITGLKIIATFDRLKPGQKKNIYPGVARSYYRLRNNITTGVLIFMSWWMTTT